MSIFKVHENVIDNYLKYAQSFSRKCKNIIFKVLNDFKLEYITHFYWVS